MISLIIFSFFFLLGLILIRKADLRLFIFLFIMLLPMKGLSPEQGGRISPDNLATAFLFIALIVTLPNRTIKLKNLVDSSRIALLILVVFYIGIHYYIKIKDLVIVGKTAYGDPPEKIFFFQIVRDITIIVTFFLLAPRLSNFKVLITIHKAIIVGCIFVSISIIFPGITDKLNLTTGFSVFERQSGLLNVNPNVAGSYCAILLGYVFSLIGTHNELSRRINKLVLIFTAVLLFIAMLQTGSRQAFAAVVFVVASFILFNWKLRARKLKILYILVILLLFIPLYNYTGDLMQERINESIEEEGGSLQSRLEHWSVYMMDIIKNPHYFLFGNTEPLPFGYKYNSHNLYIFLLWNTGIFFMSLLGYYLIKLLKYNRLSRIINSYSFDIQYCLYIFMITSFFNSFVLNITLVSIILISDGISNNNYMKMGYKRNSILI